MKYKMFSVLFLSIFSLHSMDDICLDNANLRGANFLGVSCKRTSLMNVNFSEADLRGANFEDAHLINVNFTRAKINLLPILKANGDTLPATNFRNARIENIKTDGLSLEVIAFIRSQAKQ